MERSFLMAIMPEHKKGGHIMSRIEELRMDLEQEIRDNMIYAPVSFKDENPIESIADLPLYVILAEASKLNCQI